LEKIFMPFTLPDLPYSKDALAPIMSEETLSFHHGKHHKAYIDKTNSLCAEKGLEGHSLSEVIRAARDKGDTGLLNQSGQAWNHSFFWQCLAPPGSTEPDGPLLEMIEEAFGDTEAMLARLKDEAVAHFASGWAWLVLNKGKLEITSLHDGDTPVAHEGMQPLFTLDVWEHAYYIDYRNARPDFAEKVLSNLVNWDFVARNLDGQGVSRADQEG
jgi:superoxide dismutase, Fe-Mn family